jgi:hypothetical protein
MTVQRSNPVPVRGRHLLITCAAAPLLLASPLAAQMAPQPPSREVVDANHMNLSYGTVNYDVTDFAVGSGEGALALTRRYRDGAWGTDFTTWLQNIPDPNDSTGLIGTTKVTVGSDSYTFDWGVSESNDGKGAILEDNVLTTIDGTKVIFDGVVASSDGASAATKIIKPNGAIYSIALSSGTYTPPPPCTGCQASTQYMNRIQSVTSNTGYQLKYAYESDVADATAGFMRVASITGINNAVETCSPTANACTGLVNQWPKVTFSRGTDAIGKYEQVTKANGEVYLIHSDSQDRITGIRNGTGTADDIVYAYSSGGVNVQRDGGTWTYATTFSGSPAPTTRITTITDPGNGVSTAKTNMKRGNLGYLANALGHTTLFQSDTWGRITQVTYPEGNKVQLTYGTGNNITQRREISKTPGTPADIVISAAYSCIASTRICNLPTWYKDARLNQTDYTYDSTHGGLLTETGPAAATGQPRPQTRYTYVQRYAWLSNGTGGYVQAATPVWLLASKSFCKTSAATGNPAAPCNVSGDEVNTTYDYGPNSGPNNLLLRGIVEDAGGFSLRTCYGYDIAGRKISETKPRASLSACP